MFNIWLYPKFIVRYCTSISLSSSYFINVNYRSGSERVRETVEDVTNTKFGTVSPLSTVFRVMRFLVGLGLRDF